MSEGGRGVVALFGLAVAAALGAVCWLVFSTSPPSEIATGAPAKPPRVRETPVGEKPTLRPPPTRDPRPRGPEKDRPKPPPLEIAGQVEGPDGAPVAGAAVTVFPPSAEEPAPAVSAAAESRPDPEALRELFALDPDQVKAIRPYSGVPVIPVGAASPREEASGATGEDGKFRIAVRRRGPFRLQARKEGVGSAVAGQVMVGGAPVVLRLGSSVTLEGRVVDGSAGVAEATVVLRAGTIEKGAVSGPDGTFRVEDLPPGKYSVSAGAAGHAPASLPAVEVPSSTGPLEISLAGGYSVRVSVMKWEPPPAGWKKSSGIPLPPGPPVEGVLVMLYRPAGGTFLSAVTAADGTARFERLGEGVWKIGARHAGFSVGFAREIRLKAGGPAEESREIRLQPEVPTPVRVTDEAGAAVRNARIYTGGLDEEFDERHSRLVGRTDDEGVAKYTFDDGVPFKSVLWVVPEDGRAAAMLEPEDSGSGKEEKVVVRPGRVVQGTVTDAAGKPVAGAEMTLEVVDDDRDIDYVLHACTDAAGKYRFPPTPFGEVTIDAETDADWESHDVDGDNRENPLVRDFRLETDPAAKKSAGGK